MRYHAPFTLIKRKKVWYYRVYDECGERHTYTTARTNKLEAYQYCSDLQSQGLLGFSASDLPTGRMTFADFAAGWWTPACRYVRESSLLGRHRMRYLLCGCPITDLGKAGGRNCNHNSAPGKGKVICFRRG